MRTPDPSSTELVVVRPAEPGYVSTLAQFDDDSACIAGWLHGRPVRTVRAYSADIQAFLEFVGRPLPLIRMGDLQAYADTLLHLKPASQRRKISTIKSLLTFGQKLGYLQFNAGAAVRQPKLKNMLAQRILTESQVHKMIALEENPRDHAMLRLLYLGGLRRGEVRIITGRDLTPNGDSGQITVFGKGEQTRFVLLPVDLWTELLALQGDNADRPLFRSREGGGMLDEASIWRVIKRAARRANLVKEVSTHWLRHSHATHAMERGATIQLVAATLGHSDIKTTGKYLHARPNDSSSRYLAG